MILTCNETKFVSENIILLSNTQLDTRTENINASNFYLKTYDEGEYVEIDIISVTATNDIENKEYKIEIETEALKTDKVYFLSVFGIFANSSTEDNLIPTVFKFLSIADNQTDLANNNNVYAKLKNINNMLNTEYVLKHSNDYTLKFNPTNYNTELAKYESSEEEVTICNDEIIINKLIGQYFTEYKSFYDVINSKTVDSKLYDNEYINNLHLVFMNNIAKWYSLKGNKTYIELMFTLYAKYLGENVLSIVEDSVDNFTYRISSSIPKKVWTSLIKPFVHPVSWNAIYSEIKSNTSGIYYQLPDQKKLMIESWTPACISYLDAELYSKTPNPHYIKMKQIYHSSGNIEPWNAEVHEHGGHKKVCTLKNIRDHYKYGMNINMFKAPVEYRVDPLLKELKDLKNVIYSINRFEKTIMVDFALTGVANTYIYEIYNNNTLKVVQSLLSKQVIKYEDGDTIVLKLVKNGFSQSVYKINPQAAFDTYKTLSYSNISNSVQTKMINIGCSDEVYQYNGISVGNFTSQKTNSALSYASDFEYMYNYPELVNDFNSEFNVRCNFTSVPVTVNGNACQSVNFVYPIVGAAIKYKWDIYQGSTLVGSEITYFNTTNFIVRDEDYRGISLILTIFFKNGSFTLGKITRISPYQPIGEAIIASTFIVGGAKFIPPIAETPVGKSKIGSTFIIK